MKEMNELRKIAEVATPGPWQWGPERSHWGDCGPNLETVERGPLYEDGSQGAAAEVVGSWGHDANGIFVEDHDKAFIATFDPPTVLALLKRIEYLEGQARRNYKDWQISSERTEQAEQSVERKQRALDTLARIIGMQQDAVIRATDSQDLIGDDGDGDWDAVWDRLAELADQKRKAEQDRVKLRNRLDAMRRQRNGYQNQIRKAQTNQGENK